MIIMIFIMNVIYRKYFQGKGLKLQWEMLTEMACRMYILAAQPGRQVSYIYRRRMEDSKKRKRKCLQTLLILRMWVFYYLIPIMMVILIYWYAQVEITFLLAAGNWNYACTKM